MNPNLASQADATSYDRVPYPGRPAPASHCRRLEAVAALFGLSPAPPATARVLELGCGFGGNLLPQAVEYPAARFVGCDAAATAIAAAEAQARALGLANVELRHEDLCGVDAGWGRFDYVICTGVFSWVGPDVRRRILEILRTNLAPGGVAYVSYNTLPGWHLRRAVRDLMCYHAAGFDDPTQAVAQARAALALVAEAQPDDTAYAALIREEYAKLSRADDWYLYHEMLEEHNQPVAFQEFVRQAEAAGLQYVGAADLPRMFAHDLPPSARTFVDGLPLEAREQYLDFLRGNAFRRDILCLRELSPDRRPDPSALDRFSVGLTHDARPEADESGEPLRLCVGRCDLPCPAPLAAAVRHVAERRPEFVPVSRLREIARRPPGSDDGDCLMRFLLDAVTAGALEAVLSPPRVTGRVGERPVASPWARLQAGGDGTLTNQNHEPVPISDVARMTVRLLDGTRDRRAVAEAVGREVNAGRVPPGRLNGAGEPADVAGLVDHVLAGLARAALLIA
ncbi:MAG TPA: class I SAM-dependent methyltransferase [Gemmataceae bacterium]|jgi:SAM-dependent methyltransferase